MVLNGRTALVTGASRGIGAATAKVLARRGASIQELNTVRQCLSRLKGGGLLRAAAGAPVRSLIISDVPGDRLEVIASGPTAADSSTPEAALIMSTTRIPMYGFFILCPLTGKDCTCAPSLWSWQVRAR